MLDEEAPTGRQPLYAPALRDLAYLASERYTERLDRGGVHFDLPEVKAIVEGGDEGQPARVMIELADPNSPARTLVSEMMILAGEQMGRFCAEHAIPVMYRSQRGPDGDLFDDEIASTPEGYARTFAKLKRMKRGSVGVEPAPHYALGLAAYVQATSPIRRYSDLVCQRQVGAFLRGEPYVYDREAIEVMADHAENATRDAASIERDATRYWTLYWLASQPARGDRGDRDRASPRPRHALSGRGGVSDQGSRGQAESPAGGSGQAHDPGCPRAAKEPLAQVVVARRVA